MNAQKPETEVETVAAKQVTTGESERISPSQIAIASVGGIFEGTSGHVLKYLANPVLNLGLGISPALIGVAQAIPRLWDAISDPVVGDFSDKTRTRWGRRRPHMFCGAIATGLCFAAMWWMPRGMSQSFYFWFFMLASLLFYTTATFFVVPWEAMLAEMSRDYHERTRIQAYRAVVGTLGPLIMPWLFAFTQLPMFTDSLEGVRYVGIAMGAIFIIVGLVPAIFLKERPIEVETRCEERVPVWKGLREMAQNKPFLIMVGIKLLYGPGVMMTEGLGLYVSIYYVFGGNTQAASVIWGYHGTIFALGRLLSVPLMTAVARRIGKRYAIMLCFAISLLADCLKWVCYDPNYPYLLLVIPALQMVGMVPAWVFINSMTADTVDADELATGRKRAGLFIAVSQWVRKTGVTAAFALSGFILTAIGFDVALGANQSESTLFLMRLALMVVPAVATTGSLFLAWRFPITEAKAAEMRAELERRRPRVCSQA